MEGKYWPSKKKKRKQGKVKLYLLLEWMQGVIMISVLEGDSAISLKILKILTFFNSVSPFTGVCLKETINGTQIDS